MRKLYEIVLVIAAAGLAATVALIDIPTHSPDLGTVVGRGSSLSAGPPPISDSSFPPLPPLLFPPGSSTPVPIEPLATPVPSLALGVQASSNVAQASASAMGSLGASSAQPAPTSPHTKAPATLKKSEPPPAAKPKPAPHTSKKAKPPIKPKPPHTSERSAAPPAAKPKPAHPSKKPKGEPKT